MNPQLLHKTGKTEIESYSTVIYMAEAKKKWIETKDGVEHFLQGIHVQSKHWDGPGRYEYIPDSEVYNGIGVYNRLHKPYFRVNYLIHATTPEAAANILQDGGFKPTIKYLGETFPEYLNNLVWWGISTDESSTEK